MTVTLVCDVLGEENNGTTIAAMNLARALREAGHEVRLLCPDEARRGEDGFFVVPTLNLGPLNGYVKKNGVALAKADREIISEAITGADIVHIMMPFALGRKTMALAKAEGIPVSAGFHALAENVTAHLGMMNFRPANRLVYSYYASFYRGCDAIHYPTQFLRSLYEGMYGPTNGYVISNGVPADVVPARTAPPPMFAGRHVVLFTGRYSREKSHKTLIEAVNRSAYRDSIQLVFAGEGPLEDKLKRLSEKLPVKPLFGFFARPEMIKLLNCSELYVHPAEIEAEGIACLEAICCGLVPVISDSPRCATGAYALDERSLFRCGSPDDLAAKIDYWLSHPAEREAQGQKYLLSAKGLFSREVCMREMEQMLASTAALRTPEAECGTEAISQAL